jgi:tRNA(Leu) C34 or U34 (ribose-2'-O)-methylase TrmL
LNKLKPNVYIGLTNPKSPTNVGSVMRAAGCFDIAGVYYTGERFQRAMKFNTDTKSATNKIPLLHATNFNTQVTAEVKTVVIELVEGATALPEFVHPEHVIYIFGPEDGSVSQATVDEADHVVYLPTIGCLNLAATVNIVLYDRMAKQRKLLANDDLILKSRDRNNRLTCK